MKRIPQGAEPVYAVRQTAMVHDSYGQLYYPSSQYGYVQLRNTSTGPSQVYFPNNSGSLRGSQQLLPAQRVHTDGRTTPLVLHAIPSQRVVPAALYDSRAPAGSIVVLDNVEQLYRPIAITNAKGRASVETQPATAGSLVRQRGLVRSGKHIVPYEYEVYSDAEETQSVYSGRGQTGKRCQLFII